jgi:hypothetical protein
VAEALQAVKKSALREIIVFARIVCSRNFNDEKKSLTFSCQSMIILKASANYKEQLRKN